MNCSPSISSPFVVGIQIDLMTMTFASCHLRLKDREHFIIIMRMTCGTCVLSEKLTISEDMMYFYSYDNLVSDVFLESQC